MTARKISPMLPLALIALAVAPGQVRAAATSGESIEALPALLEAAHLAESKGDPKAAWDLLSRAWQAAPADVRPARGLCRLALGLGAARPTAAMKTAAAQVCQQALVLGGTPEDMRNRVAAWLLGPSGPTMHELMSASFMADGAVRVAPAQPWGHGARAELAIRLGDRVQFDAARAELERVSPRHEETTKMLAQAPRPSGWVGFGWLVIGAVVAGTAVLALDFRRRTLVTAPVVGALLLAGQLGSAHAAGLGQAIDEAHPETSVPTVAQQLADPLGFAGLLAELAARAELATKRADHAAAARYQVALTRAVPDRSPAFAALCDSLEASGDREGALTACRTALTRTGSTAADYTHFVRLLLQKDGALTIEERRQVDVAIARLETEPAAAIITERVRCNLSLHENDVAGLESCTSKLLVAAPTDPRTISFAWALAAAKRDRSAAFAVADRAAAAGVAVGTVADMRRFAGEFPRGRGERGLLAAAAGLGFVLLGFGLVRVVQRVRFLRRRAATPVPQS